MLHNLVMQNGRGGTLILGDTNIPVCIDVVHTSIDNHPEIECHVTGAIYGGTRTNYAKLYKGGSNMFAIKDVIFSNPATIVLWADGTKTVVKCQEGDVYSEEVGLALCFAKKALGNKSNYNNVFKKWIPEEDGNTVHLDIPASAASSVASKIMSKLKDTFNRDRTAFEL